MDMQQPSRRRWLLSACGLGAGWLATSRFAFAAEHENAEVTANEDLMREHGVMRRALVVYLEAARRARRESRSLPLASLGDAARLFREFGEDYHEHMLEEGHIFPAVRKLKGPIAKLPDVLLDQYRRGREITEYVRKIASRTALGSGEAGSLADALESFVRMYEPHAAREDTELFPAWKAALGEKAYAGMGQRFEEIEHRTFGRDGFEYALKRIESIERSFGLEDLASMTAPPPRAL
jgi:hemerythrin-like domain-containing protein